jgi:acetyl-CoA carboxylase biotin carboxyl carrier protein
MMAKDKRREKKARSNRSSAPDLAVVSEILAFMEQHSLEEFEYENGALHVRLRKAAAHVAHPFRVQQPAPEIFVAAPAPAASPSPSAATPPQSPAAELRADLHVIKSPIVGTFYSAPSPGASPFVRTGDHVTPGQVLCIIEAMKLMNEIEADLAGEVMRIFVENGQPVEYGEPLFAIHPSRKQ